MTHARAQLCQPAASCTSWGVEPLCSPTGCGGAGSFGWPGWLPLQGFHHTSLRVLLYIVGLFQVPRFVADLCPRGQAKCRPWYLCAPCSACLHVVVTSGAVYFATIAICVRVICSFSCQFWGRAWRVPCSAGLQCTPMVHAVCGLQCSHMSCL